MLQRSFLAKAALTLVGFALVVGTPFAIAQEEGDGLAFDRFIVVGSELMRRFRAAFLLRDREGRPHHQREAHKCQGRLRQE